MADVNEMVDHSDAWGELGVHDEREAMEWVLKFVREWRHPDLYETEQKELNKNEVNVLVALTETTLASRNKAFHSIGANRLQVLLSKLRSL